MLPTLAIHRPEVYRAPLFEMNGVSFDLRVNSCSALLAYDPGDAECGMVLLDLIENHAVAQADPVKKAFAIYALGVVLPTQTNVVNALGTLARDPDDAIASTARDALERIEWRGRIQNRSTDNRFRY